MNALSGTLLRVTDLRVDFHVGDATIHAVNGIDFKLRVGECLAIVGESGSGKSATAMSILGLIPRPGQVGGTIEFRGTDLLEASPKELAHLCGGEIAMVFQDPMTALNPVMTVGSQINEAIKLHQRALPRRERRQHVIDLLKRVGIGDAESVVKRYPHQISGGMCQRALIAMAIANDPAVVIADEPTTALDVTVQAQVLAVLRDVLASGDSAGVIITHDLGVVSQIADRVLVMYAGLIVEEGDVRSVLDRPSHPYTLGLINSVPRIDGDPAVPSPIPGSAPDLSEMPNGCPFEPRCLVGRGRDVCRTTRPLLEVLGDGHRSACHFSDEVPMPGIGAAGTARTERECAGDSGRKP